MYIVNQILHFMLAIVTPSSVTMVCLRINCDSSLVHDEYGHESLRIMLCKKCYVNQIWQYFWTDNCFSIYQQTDLNIDQQTRLGKRRRWFNLWGRGTQDGEKLLCIHNWKPTMWYEKYAPTSNKLEFWNGLQRQWL